MIAFLKETKIMKEYTSFGEFFGKIGFEGAIFISDKLL